MRLTHLELKNFRTFKHVVLTNLPNFIVIVAPNGRGKSTLLEAVAGAHELITPYGDNKYPFRSDWERSSLEVWPDHFPSPVKIGEERAEITIEVEPTEHEANYLKTKGIEDTHGTAKIILEHGKYVISKVYNDAIHALFSYHSLKDGIGMVDYIRPIRYYSNRSPANYINDMSDTNTRNLFSEFQLPINNQRKFELTQSYIANCRLKDFAYQQKTGECINTLKPFIDVFNHFFAPKEFLGFRMDDDDRPCVEVASPFGTHDVDALSQGEKEIYHQLAHLFRFRTLANVVLWDTPELHLNAALESRLYDAILNIAPLNQTWIATHSFELINSVPLSNVFVIKQSDTYATVEPLNDGERKARVELYSDLGAQVGLQLVSSVVAFVEGPNSYSDKRILDRLVASEMPAVNFVAGDSCDNLLSVGTKANALLNEACLNGDFLAIIDRDYRSDEEVGILENKYKGRLFIWRVHEIDNLFLDPTVAYDALHHLGRTESGMTPDTIKTTLLGCCHELVEWIAADWTACQLHNTFQPPPRRIAGHDPQASLSNYLATLKAKLADFTDSTTVDTLNNQLQEKVRNILNSPDWLSIMPGKQLMVRWLSSFQPAITPQIFVDTAIGTLRHKKIELPEIARLKKRLLGTAT